MADQLVRIELQDGTEYSGFVRGGQNRPPRTCGNCIWVGFESCGHPIVLMDPANKLRNDRERFPVDGDDCCNSFQSQGNVLLYIVRHGATITDEQGKHGGWQNDPLSAVGRQQAQDAKGFLEGKKFGAVYSSDMARAIETAKIISGKDPEQDKQLRPWDVGIFTGKDHDLVEEVFQQYLDHPSREIPDGEAMAAYAVRMHKALLKYIEIARQQKMPVLIVCHSRNFSQFKRQLENKDELDHPDKWDKVNEGGVMTVLEEKNEGKVELKVEIVFNRGDEGKINLGS